MAYTVPNFRNAPTAYLQANSKLQKQPIYYCKFGLVTGPAGTNSQVLPTQFATGPILNSTMTRSRVMSPPRSFSSQINPVTFVGTLGQVTFDLQDLGGVITNMVASYTIKNRYVTIYRGFAFINESDYTPVFSGQINDWQLSQDTTYYTFTVVDPLKMAHQTILNGHTTLAADWTQGTNYQDANVTWQYIGNVSALPWKPSTAYKTGMTVSNNGSAFRCVNPGTSALSGGPTLPQAMVVSSVYGFATATDMNDGLGPRNYLKVGNNLFSYTGITGGSIVDGSVVWSFTGSYGLYSQTNDNGILWICLGPTSNTAPAWANNTAYAIGQQIVNNGYLWTPVKSGTSAAAGSGPQYSATLVLFWTPNIAYVVGNLVVNNKVIYVCQSAGTSAPIGGPAGVGVIGGQAFIGIRCVTLNNNGEIIAQTHQAGSAVDNYVLFQGNPIDIILQILMSSGDGNNFSGTGTNYDVFPLGQGIGIPYTSVNISNIVNNVRGQISNMTFYGYFTDQVKGLKFIQENILPMCLCFLYTNVNGNVDMNIPYPAGSLDAITLDQTNIVDNPQFKANIQTGGYFYNDVDVSYDYQPVGDYYLSENVTIDGVSLTGYREDSKLTLSSKMITTFFNGLAAVLRMQSIYLSFFKNPPPVITCKTFDAMTLLNPGSLVYLNHPNVPNYQTGKRGGNFLCMVITASPDYFDGAMNVTLLGIGFYQRKKYARWSPQSILNSGSFPTYTNATSIQKRYGFWGNKVATTYSQQSNGDDGTYWGP
jgi:hypothetical protein